jgi:hypothetical protein
MTRNLKRFALWAVGWAAAYLGLLYASLHGWSAPREAVISLFVVFTVVLVSLETHYRRSDDQRSVRFSLPVAYSLVSASASALVVSGWALAWRDNLALVGFLGAAAVAVILILGALATKNRIKAYSKEQLFP